MVIFTLHNMLYVHIHNIERNRILDLEILIWLQKIIIKRVWFDVCMAAVYVRVINVLSIISCVWTAITYGRLQ